MAEQQVNELEAFLIQGLFGRIIKQSSALIATLPADRKALRNNLHIRQLFVLVQAFWLSNRPGELEHLFQQQFGGVLHLPPQVFVLWQLFQLEHGNLQTTKQQVEQYLVAQDRKLQDNEEGSYDCNDEQQPDAATVQTGELEQKQLHNDQVHLQALCRLYVTDILCEGLRKYEAASAWLNSGCAMRLLGAEEQQLLAQDVRQLLLQNSSRAAGGNAAVASSDTFCTMLGELSDDDKIQPAATIRNFGDGATTSNVARNARRSWMHQDAEPHTAKQPPQQSRDQNQPCKTSTSDKAATATGEMFSTQQYFKDLPEFIQGTMVSAASQGLNSACKLWSSAKHLVNRTLDVVASLSSATVPATKIQHTAAAPAAAAGASSSADASGADRAPASLQSTGSSNSSDAGGHACSCSRAAAPSQHSTTAEPAAVSGTTSRERHSGLPASQQPRIASENEAHAQPTAMLQAAGAAAACALLAYALYAERHSISTFTKKRLKQLHGMVFELLTMSLSLTPSPISSGYRPVSQ